MNAILKAINGGRRARPRHLEDAMQVNLMSYLSGCWYGDRRVSEIIFHVPNGGKRNAFEAARLQKMGVRAGVYDLCLPVPVRSYHGAFFELKATTDLTEKQIIFGRMINEFGYYNAVHRSWPECAQDIIGYLKAGPLLVRASPLRVN